MIDVSLIKENYSRMSDYQLVLLAKTEGKDLSVEALGILHEEFRKRKLDISVFETVEQDKIVQKKVNIEKSQDEFMQLLWIYALDEKKEGTTDKEIVKGLMEKGLDEEHSEQIINTLETKTKAFFKKYDGEMNTGGLVCIAGIAVTFITYISALNGGTYLVAWGAIIFGAINFFRAASNKEKYKTILANIEAEKTRTHNIK